jgi:hypothetical protein
MTSMSRKEMNGKLLRKAGLFFSGVAQFEKGLGKLMSLIRNRLPQCRDMLRFESSEVAKCSKSGKAWAL